jgi:hypothetical protein
MARMFLAECCWPGVSVADVAETLARAEALHNEENGVAPVRLVDSLLIPEDEIVLSIFEGPSAGAVHAAAQQIELPCDRVVETIWLTARRDNPIPRGRRRPPVTGWWTATARGKRTRGANS